MAGLDHDAAIGRCIAVVILRQQVLRRAPCLAPGSLTCALKSIETWSASHVAHAQADVEDGLRAWVGAHPELRRLMSDLVAAVLRDKPADPVAFAKEWVAALDMGEA